MSPASAILFAAHHLDVGPATQAWLNLADNGQTVAHADRGVLVRAAHHDGEVSVYDRDGDAVLADEDGWCVVVVAVEEVDDDGRDTDIDWSEVE